MIKLIDNKNKNSLKYDMYRLKHNISILQNIGIKIDTPIVNQ